MTFPSEIQNRANLTGYNLYLSDGNRWLFRGDAYLSAWLDKFSSIMELKSSSYEAKLKLSFSIDFNSYSPSSLPRKQQTLENEAGNFTDLKSLCLWYNNDLTDVICKVKPFDKHESEIVNMWKALYPVYLRSIRLGGIPFHAGLVEFDGKGIMLAGAGDVGKSTCCSRLPDYWFPICDDESLLILDNDRNYRAHPFPTWSDYLWKGSKQTWDVQYSVPVLAMFFIEKSVFDDAIPLGKAEAAVNINESASQVCRKYWRITKNGHQSAIRKTVFENACEMAKRIPAFKLKVRLNGRFWEKIERVLVL